jgi:hypothetical protein
MFFNQFIHEELARKLNAKVDKVIEEGLALKGFSFSDRRELEEFIKHRCRIEDYVDAERKVYFVDEIPFLEHFYRPVTSEPLIVQDSVTITVDIGSYRYI